MTRPRSRPIPPDRYPVTPFRWSKKWIITGIVSVVLLLVICLSGLVLSMSGGGGMKPASGAPAGPAASSARPAGGGPTKATDSPKPAASKTTTAPAKPPSGNSVAMPDVVGLNAADAEARLHDLGLRNLRFASGDKRYLMVLVLHNWTVTKQSVAAGTQVDRLAEIVLTCVKP
jgi:hypothetical protein